jgi:diguanylate cyclase (GGDEF)-like protein
VLSAILIEAGLRVPLPGGAGTVRTVASDLRRSFLSRLSLWVAPPALALAMLGARNASDPAALGSILGAFVALVLLLWAAALNLTRQVEGSLRKITAVANDVQAGRSSGRFTELAVSPIEEIQRLNSQLTSMHDALAHHDPVTGLPNQNLLQDRLGVAVAQAARARESFALLLVDLDRFRVLDSSLGRLAADELLRRIGQRLQECVKPGDTVARMGGDEFALLIPRMGRMEEGAEMALKLMDAIKRPFSLEGREVFVTATVGIGLYPRDGHNAETLLKNTTAATYVAKERGQDSYRRYTARITARDAQRLVVESGLRRALDHGDFVLHYQPIVELASDSVREVEALIRWNRPDVGLVAAAEFIAVAEASGLIVAMDSWVLRTACLEAKQWRSRGHDFGVAVNLSGRQFQQPDIVAQVAGALQAAGLNPEALDLEITEGVAVQDVDRGVEILRDLRDLGVSISIDDFGTGYSSLSYLRRLPVTRVKLDKAFVRDITTSDDDAAIATAVIAMAHSLKLKVVAEGVEDEHQLAFLRRHGCDAIQGYYLSHPAPPADLETILAQRKKLSA